MTHVLLALLLLALTPGAVAEIVAELHALPEATVKLSRPIDFLAESDAEAVYEVAIRYGDILALRMTIRNESDEHSQPVNAYLAPGLRPAITMVDKNGREYDVHSYTTRRAAPPRNRPMRPWEEVTLDIFLILRHVRDDQGRDIGFEYVFPKSGVYHLYFRHSPDAPGRSANEPPREPREPLTSNRVTVHVGPPIPAWEQLREAGIVHAVGSTDWPQAFETPQALARIDRLIAIADRPWLTRWFDDVTEHRRKREEERKRQEEDRQRAAESPGE
jgi:hypothetical protein